MTLYDINSSIGRRLSAAADENAATKRFLDNVNALSQDGYRRLALALLDAGGDVASRFAEAAAKDQEANNWRDAPQPPYDVTVQGDTAYVFDGGGLPHAERADEVAGDPRPGSPMGRCDETSGREGRDCQRGRPQVPREVQPMKVPEGFIRDTDDIETVTDEDLCAPMPGYFHRPSGMAYDEVKLWVGLSPQRRDALLDGLWDMLDSETVTERERAHLRDVRTALLGATNAPNALPMLHGTEPLNCTKCGGMFYPSNKRRTMCSACKPKR